MSGRTGSNFTKPLKVRSDRCANPLNVDGHVGKQLRKIPLKLLKKFRNLSENSRICRVCLEKCNENAMYHSSDVSSEENCNKNAKDDSSELTDDLEMSGPNIRKTLSREAQLETLLTGLKKKFSSLPVNDPLRISILTIAPDCWSIRDTASEFGTSRYAVEKARALKKSEGILAMPTPKIGKRLSNSTVEKVVEFYENDINSRIMPNKKDTVSIKIDNKRKKVQKRLLLCDIKILHTQFKEQNPEAAVGLSKFAELRPKWCVLAGSKGTHSVCVCVIHENFKSMFNAVDFPAITKDLQNPLTRYKDCFQILTCRNAKPACYLRSCSSCYGVDKLSELLVESLNTQTFTEVIFSTWQSTDRCTLKKECLSVDDYIDELCNGAEKLLPHHFISKNQEEYIMNRRNNLREDEVLFHLDFSENYAYVVQNAAQAFHYNNDQCTVHPSIFYYKSENKIEHKSIVLLSDCTTHDTTAVYILQRTVIPEIKKICPKVKRIIYVTDGAKQHYKNRFQMINLMHHQQDFGVPAEWHFHATAHGKGACDGIGAILKREATRASLQAKSTEAILTSENLYKWAVKKFDGIQFFHYSKQEHNRTLRSLQRRYSTAPSVTNIQLGHAFLPIKEKKLEVRRYSGAVDLLSTIQY